jgi:hypothetical protein
VNSLTAGLKQEQINLLHQLLHHILIVAQIRGDEEQVYVVEMGRMARMVATGQTATTVKMLRSYLFMSEAKLLATYLFQIEDRTGETAALAGMLETAQTVNKADDQEQDDILVYVNVWLDPLVVGMEEMLDVEATAGMAAMGGMLA